MPFSCEKCNDTFKTQSFFDLHIKNTYDPTRPFMCSKCFQTFQFKEKLDHHFARKHELRNCENCPYCGKQCARLKAHILICSAKPTKDCPNCNKPFASQDSLRHHLRNNCKK